MPTARPGLRFAGLVLSMLGVLGPPACSSSTSDEEGGPSSGTDPTKPIALDREPGVSVEAGSEAARECLADTVAPSRPDGAASVTITVAAERGPKGQPAPVAVDDRIVATSIADWQPQDYKPTPKPNFLAYLRGLHPGVLRWPAGHRSQEYNWLRGGGGQGGNFTLTPADVDAFIALAKAAGAQPLFAINVKTGTVAAAQDLVRYLNIEKGYGVKWFQIGNEPDLTDDLTANPEVYASQLASFADGMRAIDPAVKMVGPEMLTGAHVGGMHGTVDWMGRILAAAGDRLDAVSWHYYPLDTAQPNPQSSATFTIENLFQETAVDWRPAALAFADEVMPALARLRDAHARRAEIWVTEMAEDPGPLAGAGISDTLASAMWVGDALGRYAEYGPGAVLRWVWKSNGHAYSLLDPNDQPRPAYGAYWLFARHLGRRFVDAQSSALTTVSAHAALREDGALTVILVNKTRESQTVHLDVTGFRPCTGDTMTLDGDDFGSTAFTINGRTLEPDALDGAIAPAALDPGALRDLTLPATSVVVVAYHP